MGTKKKSIIMFVLAIVLVVMGVTYAAVMTTLEINGTANLEATWDISITGISDGTPTGQAYNKETPSYGKTHAQFKVGFKALGDKMDYEITITNNGSLDAIVDDVLVRYSFTDNSLKNVQYASWYIEGLKQGDIIEGGDNCKFHVIIDYPEYIKVPKEELDFSFSIVVDLVPYNNQSYSEEYKANDRVKLDDGNIWRVLVPSNSNTDTVTLIRETPINDIFRYPVAAKEYLNADYKQTLPDSMKSKLVGDIEIPILDDLRYNGYSAPNYISDFINGVLVDCSRLISGQSCNLDWLAYNVTFGTEGYVHIDLDGKKYFLLDGERSSVCTSGTISNQNPALGASIKVNVDSIYYDNSVSIVWVFLEDKYIASPFDQDCSSYPMVDLESVNIHPVITINKSAIK